LTTLAIDLTVIAIVAFCGWRGYRNGLIRGVFGVVALAVSLFLANIAANTYSEEFTGMLKPFVGGIVDSALTEIVDEGLVYNPLEHEHENDTEEFGTAYTALRLIGLPEPAAVRIAEMALERESEESLSDMIADRLSSVLAYVAVFAIAFVLLAIIFAVIGNLIGFVFSLPGLKIVDIIAGALFGLAKGLILVFALAAIVRYFGLLALETLEGTSVLNYLVNNNPIADMLGI
jgi:uncharacterized membrane protein required for colicin V production